MLSNDKDGEIFLQEDECMLLHQNSFAILCQEDKCKLLNDYFSGRFCRENRYMLLNDNVFERLYQEAECKLWNGQLPMYCYANVWHSKPFAPIWSFRILVYQKKLLLIFQNPDIQERTSFDLSEFWYTRENFFESSNPAWYFASWHSALKSDGQMAIAASQDQEGCLNWESALGHVGSNLDSIACGSTVSAT